MFSAFALHKVKKKNLLHEWEQEHFKTFLLSFLHFLFPVTALKSH